MSRRRAASQAVASRSDDNTCGRSMSGRRPAGSPIARGQRRSHLARIDGLKKVASGNVNLAPALLRTCRLRRKGSCGREVVRRVALQAVTIEQGGVDDGPLELTIDANGLARQLLEHQVEGQ